MMQRECSVLATFTTLQFTMPMKKIILLQTTVSDIKDARKIAKILLQENLIACAQIDGPLESIYRWKDKVETETEYRLGVKTTEDLAEEVISAIEKNHPYDLPEIVGNAYELISTEYANWVAGEVENG